MIRDKIFKNSPVILPLHTLRPSHTGSNKAILAGVLFTNLAAISLKPCRSEFFHRDQKPHGDSLTFVDWIIHTTGDPLQFQLPENISHIVNGLRCICCYQVMMNLKWYSSTFYNFPTYCAVFPSTVCYHLRPLSCKPVSLI